MISLPSGPSGNGQKNSTGDTTLTPTSQIHTETIEFDGLGTTRNVSIVTTGLDAGARINVVAIWVATAANDMPIVIKNSNGTQLFTFTRSGSEANALFKVESTGYGGLRAIEQTIPAFPTL